MKKAVLLFAACTVMLVLSACSNEPKQAEQSQTSQMSQSESNESEQIQESTSIMDTGTECNAIGAMSPEDALEYMQTTSDLVIVDVAATRWYEENHFEGAINIPIEELESEAEDALYMEIPAGRPVLLHCRLGMIVPGAYERILELRSDIPEISYIDGAPLFDEYNAWLAEQG
ncbi:MULTISPECIES: rhodanese-like domain-containing protein [unclassified Lactonifactor]|uniref:rhodanese-like domain-containing protein n=1 Tax=unclassified Lactonifactor TaxID=2636670 RepID=UPI001FAAE26B|nr:MULTISPECIES: rhodanese-like domain-containing protein [unclassified Lactonifactor]